MSLEFTISISSFLGILLRATIDIDAAGVLARYSLADRINDILQAVIIAVAILLLSELASWFFENQWLTSGHNSDVTTLSWHLSLVGLLAGLARTEYLEELIQKAKKQVTG